MYAQGRGWGDRYEHMWPTCTHAKSLTGVCDMAPSSLIRRRKNQSSGDDGSDESRNDAVATKSKTRRNGVGMTDA